MPVVSRRFRFCLKCGRRFEEVAEFCPDDGWDRQGQPPTPNDQENESNGQQTQQTGNNNMQEAGQAGVAVVGVGPSAASGPGPLVTRRQWVAPGSAAGPIPQAHSSASVLMDAVMIAAGGNAADNEVRTTFGRKRKQTVLGGADAGDDGHGDPKNSKVLPKPYFLEVFHSPDVIGSIDKRVFVKAVVNAVKSENSSVLEEFQRAMKEKAERMGVDYPSAPMVDFEPAVVHANYYRGVTLTAPPKIEDFTAHFNDNVLMSAAHKDKKTIYFIYNHVLDQNGKIVDEDEGEHHDENTENDAVVGLLLLGENEQDLGANQLPVQGEQDPEPEEHVDEPEEQVDEPQVGVVKQISAASGVNGWLNDYWDFCDKNKCQKVLDQHLIRLQTRLGQRLNDNMQFTEHYVRLAFKDFGKGEELCELKKVIHTLLVKEMSDNRVLPGILLCGPVSTKYECFPNAVDGGTAQRGGVSKFALANLALQMASELMSYLPIGGFAPLRKLSYQEAFVLGAMVMFQNIQGCGSKLPLAPHVIQMCHGMDVFLMAHQLPGDIGFPPELYLSNSNEYDAPTFRVLADLRKAFNEGEDQFMESYYKLPVEIRDILKLNQTSTDPVTAQEFEEMCHNLVYNTVVTQAMESLMGFREGYRQLEFGKAMGESLLDGEAAGHHLKLLHRAVPLTALTLLEDVLYIDPIIQKTNKQRNAEKYLRNILKCWGAKAYCVADLKTWARRGKVGKALRGAQLFDRIDEIMSGVSDGLPMLNYFLLYVTAFLWLPPDTSIDGFRKFKIEILFWPEPEPPGTPQHEVRKYLKAGTCAEQLFLPVDCKSQREFRDRMILSFMTTGNEMSDHTAIYNIQANEGMQDIDDDSNADLSDDSDLDPLALDSDEH